MGRLTINDVEPLRANGAPLSTQIAAFTAAEFYKSPHAKSKLLSPLLTHHFSIESRIFAGSKLKKTANQPVKHSFIPLGTGRPTVDFYPWETFTLRGGSTYPDTPQCASGRECSAPQDKTILKRDGSYDLAHGLNYGHAVGSQPLVRYVTEHIEIVHDPPYRGWAIALTCGSTAALEISLRMLCNRGETVLTERFTYPGMIEVSQLLGLQTLGIDMDGGGLRPESLESALRDWDVSRGPRPAVLYTIPSGQNPTGATQSLARKARIYEVAQRYDLIVIEDDPYYFLLTEPSPKPAEDHQAEPTAYQSSLPQSYLSLDHDGRVIRLDSVSKILAPGLRAGWITANEEIIEKFTAYQEVSTVSVSGPTQLMLWSLLEATWGHRGLFAWLDHLSTQYRFRLDILLQACEKNLPKTLCTWTRPQNGMFLWISVDLQRHPNFNLTAPRGYAQKISHVARTQTCDIESRIYATALAKGVQITKGSLFDTRQSSEDTLHLRLTYAAAAEADFEEAIRVLGQVISDEFTLPN